MIKNELSPENAIKSTSESELKTKKIIPFGDLIYELKVDHFQIRDLFVDLFDCNNNLISTIEFGEWDKDTISEESLKKPFEWGNILWNVAVYKDNSMFVICCYSEIIESINELEYSIE